MYIVTTLVYSKVLHILTQNSLYVHVYSISYTNAVCAHYLIAYHKHKNIIFVISFFSWREILELSLVWDSLHFSEVSTHYLLVYIAGHHHSSKVTDFFYSPLTTFFL